MEYETGVFKRYIRNRTDKDGKKKEVTQVGVSGLSINSKFEDDEEIVLLSMDELTQLETKANKSIELENQLKEAKLKIETLETTTPEPNTENPKYQNRVIDLQERINNRNELLMNTQNTINNVFNEVTTANNTSKDNLLILLSELQTDIDTIIDLSKELPSQVNGINSSIDNINWLKWIRSKNKFKIVMDIDKLKEVEAKLVSFTSQDIVQLANNIITPMEISTENLNLNKLYISIDTEDSGNESIPSKVITSKDE